MKKGICVLFVLLLGILMASAQDSSRKWLEEIKEPPKKPLYRHEVSAVRGIGAFFGNKRFKSFTDDIENKYGLFGGGGIPISSTMSIRYFYHLKRYLVLGGSIGIAGRSENYYREDWDFYDTGIVARSCYLMPTIKGQWVDNKGFGLYSKLGLGIGVQYMRMESDFYEDEGVEDWCVHPSWQITFLGMDFGIRKFRINLEFGVGLESVFSIGTTYYFDRVRK